MRRGSVATTPSPAPRPVSSTGLWTTTTPCCTRSLPSSSTSTSLLLDPQAKLLADIRWLIDNPEFEERPPDIVTFLGPDYLNIRKNMRKRIVAELVEIFGEEFTAGHIARYKEALITGGIGIGKTTIASIVLSYMACCTLCLKDPQEYYDLLPGSKIAFMMMSSKRTVALEVIFQDTKARIDNSPWFKSRHPRDGDYKNLIAFEKNIHIIPGDSLETTFEGYNILGGVMDEIDSHKLTLTKDYAESGYSTISARITSRFGDRGFLILIGQTKTEGGFAMRRMKEFATRPDCYAVKMAIWESLDPEKFCGQKFYYDIVRSKVIHPEEFVAAGMTLSENLIEIPVEYLQNFTLDPDKALRDLAGVPRKVADPFIRNTDKITTALFAYLDRRPLVAQPWHDGMIDPLFRCEDSLPRYGHIDLAYSANGDAAGLAIGHISDYVDTDDGPKAFIVIDFAARITPAPGRQIELSDVRDVLYQLQRRGFKIKYVSLDGFQSVDTMQTLRKHGIRSELLSVDTKMLPYSDLRDAIYDERIAIPTIIDRRWRTDPKPFDLTFAELSELGYTPNGLKVDHPAQGSKDVADAIAGTVHNLMLRARRGGSMRQAPAASTNPTQPNGQPGYSQLGMVNPFMNAPQPPPLGSNPFGSFGNRDST